MKRVAVLASGRGSNLAALLEAQGTFASYKVVLLVSNVEASRCLDVAAAAGVEAITVPSVGLSRDHHEKAMLGVLADRAIDVLCLAGYMRVLGGAFVDTVSRPILNVHPSLLPAFPGLHAQRQALAAGVRWSGATVHFVDAGLDSGPIILQEPVPVKPGDTEAALSGRILEVEHRLYPQAVDWVAREAYAIKGRTVHLHDRKEL